ncbi:MAG: type IX secretion system membrane protein PorP/SprF, partial [Bacteroidota bacterium]
MTKLHFIFLFLLGIMVSRGQDVELPPDLRQHNLTEYNASLFSPVFSLDRNNPESIALWSRWQWQTIDGDPTTIFLNYTRRLDIQSAIGGGFFQHNTGVFLNTGGVLNYAYALNLKSNAQISFGINLFGF